MRIATIACTLLGLGACAGPALHWSDPPVVEDPAPNGTPELRAYKEAYYRSLGDRLAGHLTREELMDRIAGARVLYLGDRHDDPELHDRMLALLDALHARGVQLAFGLEAIGTEDEAAVGAYLDQLASMAELRRVIHARWPRSWLDRVDVDVDATFYRTVLALARAWKAPVFGLEPAPRVLTF